MDRKIVSRMTVATCMLERAGEWQRTVDHWIREAYKQVSHDPDLILKLIEITPECEAKRTMVAQLGDILYYLASGQHPGDYYAELHYPPHSLDKVGARQVDGVDESRVEAKLLRCWQKLNCSYEQTVPDRERGLLSCQKPTCKFSYRTVSDFLRKLLTSLPNPNLEQILLAEENLMIYEMPFLLYHSLNCDPGHPVHAMLK